MGSQGAGREVSEIGGRDPALSLRHSAEAAQNPHQQNDRQRNPNQPQQQALAHVRFLQMLRCRRANPEAKAKVPAYIPRLVGNDSGLAHRGGRPGMGASSSGRPEAQKPRNREEFLTDDPQDCVLAPLCGKIFSPELEKKPAALQEAPRWRDGRVAEGARLESVYTGNRIEGSNPSLSARATQTTLLHGLCQI